MVGGGGGSTTVAATTMGATTTGGTHGSTSAGGGGWREGRGGARPVWVVAAAVGGDRREGPGWATSASATIVVAGIEGRGAGGGARPSWVVLLGARTGSDGGTSSTARDRVGFLTSEMRATAASLFTGGGGKVATIDGSR